MINEIMKQLERAEKEYYKNGTSFLSDEEFDNLKEQLEELDPNNPYLMKVGSEDLTDTKFIQISHGVYNMASLNKINTKAELYKWYKKGVIVVDEKEDGISIKLIYKNGKLVQGITRGDGTKGFDITANILQMDVQKEIDYKQELIVRGEIILTHPNFEIVKSILEKEGNVISKSPRNLAAGLAKREKDSKNCKFLIIRVYDIMNMDTSPLDIKVRLKELFKEKYITKTYACKNEKEVYELYEKYILTRSQMKYDIDGLVLKCIDENIAFKFPPSIKSTYLIGVNWQVGSSGRITPVGQLEPIELNGATIQNVSLYNLDFITKMNIKIGDKISVSRRGDVIPKVVEILEKKGDSLPIPTHCPTCNKPLVIEEKYLVCPNITCPTKIISQIVKWFEVHEIKGISDKTIETLYNGKIFNNFIEFLYLKDGLKDSKILKLGGVGQTTVDLVKNSINKTLQTTIPLFLSGMNLGDVDEKIIENILKQLSIDNIDIEEFINILTGKTKIDLTTFNGLGDIRVNLIRNKIINFIPLCNELLKIIHVVPYKKQKTIGKSFLITGTLSKPRKEVEDYIKSKGGELKSSVSKELSYLIVGDSPGSKLDKANQLGVKVIDENELYKILGV